MTQKDNTNIPHGLIICKPLTPEQAAELKRVLSAELDKKPHRYSTTAFVTSGDRASCSLVRNRKALWFIAGMGTGTLIAAAAFVVFVLWMV